MALLVYEDMKAVLHLFSILNLINYKSSVQSQKGAIAIQRCFVESQKGAFAIQRCSVEIVQQ